MDPVSPFAAVAAAEREGRFSPGVLAMLTALAPFAHWGELDGIPGHIAGLFQEHERAEVREYLTNASVTFRKVLAPKEQP